MRVLFLDIDGVLNSQTWFEFQRYPVVELTNRIDPEAALRVNRITQRTGATLILSSNWVYDTTAGMENTVSALRARGIKAPIQGHTVRKMSLYCRAEEIRMTLGSMREAGQEVESFVILEDEERLPNLSEWTVRTQWATGLQDEHVDLAVRILQRPWDGTFKDT